jgi:hypothetical protein
MFLWQVLLQVEMLVRNSQSLSVQPSKLWDENRNVYVAIANEALYDDNKAQVESLLSIHQALADPKNGIDDCAHCEHNVDGKPGWQKVRFGSKEVSFFFDRSKCFFEISTITQEEMNTLPRIYIHGRLTKEYVPWSDTRPFLSIYSIWTIIQSSTMEISFGIYSWPRGWQNSKCNDTDGGYSWGRDSGTYARSFGLAITGTKVHCVNDTACVDMFFSSITSVQGFTCWTQYCFLKSSFDAVYLMRQRSQGPSTLPKMVTNCGAPNEIRSDNEPKFKGHTWMTYLETSNPVSLYRSISSKWESFWTSRRCS